MADHGHTHEDGHGHVHGSNSLVFTISFLLLAGVELWAGSVTQNASISSLGGHSLVDAGFPLISLLTAGIAGVFAKRQRIDSPSQRLVHWMSCQLQVCTGVILALSNILLIGILPLVFAPSNLSSQNAYAGIALGGVDLASKVAAVMILSRRAGLIISPRLLAKTSSLVPAEHAPVIEHFRLDAEAAFATMVGSAMTGLTGEIKWIIATVGFILARSLLETIPQLRSLSRKIHRTASHREDEPQREKSIDKSLHDMDHHSHDH